MTANVHCVEAPEEYHGPGPSLFLAGGITGTEDWQQILIGYLSGNALPLVLLNPRRKNYPWHEPAAAEEQIAWEYRYLRKATGVVFWFPAETLCPIALFELGGRVLVKEQPLFVGTDPDYARRLDVEIQMKLARPEVAVVSDLAALGRQVQDWLVRGGEEIAQPEGTDPGGR
jgi:hypothetical protein